MQNRLVPGEGELESKLWIIGEAPGATEEKEGKPFCGWAGEKLNRMLQRGGIDRSRCYIDNVIQIRPPGNNFGIYYTDKSRNHPTPELTAAHDKIKSLVSKYRPNVVIALGNESLYALTGKKEIMKWRGSILGYNGVKIIPTIHPAMILREPKFQPVVETDMDRALRESICPGHTSVYEDNFTINPSFEVVMEYLTNILTKKDIISFDIETIPDLEQIMCIGFAWSKESAICIPIFFGNSSWWSVQEEMEIIKAVQGLFSASSRGVGPRMIAQNAQYDLTYLMDKWNVPFPNIYMDTMIAFHCVYPELKKSLAFLTSIYTNRPYYKDDGGQGNTPDQEWIYNCRDNCVTYECAGKIREEMKEFNTLDFYNKYSLPLVEPLLKMQRKGVLIDKEMRSRLDKEYSDKVDEVQERLNKIVGYEVSVGSPKQMKKLLYDDLGLPLQYTWGMKGGRKTKVITTKEEAIEELMKITKNPILEMILEIRGMQKLLSTYIRAILEPNGRITCSYHIAGSKKKGQKSGGTETGRLSSSKNVYNRGTNLQNIPRDRNIRDMFIADKGFLLVNADLSQAEARIVAYESGDEMMIDVFESGKDIHIVNASIIFSCNYSSVTGDQRQIAKGRVHGTNYKLGYKKAAKLAGTSEFQARSDINKYTSSYPGLQVWWMDIEKELQATRTLKTVFGRKRMFFGRWNDDLIREGIAYRPQSTVGDLLNYGIIRCYKNLPPEWELLMQNHDSVVMQVPEWTEHMHIYKFLKHYFEIQLTIKGRIFKIPIDIKIGKRWGDMRKMEKMEKGI